MANPYYGYGGIGSEDAAALYSSYEIDRIAARYSGTLPYPSAAAAAVDAHVGARRSAEALYHQSIMGSHNTVGQSEALYSSNTMVKRPRLESSLPIYPQRPGEKDCAFYMLTRTCKFGDACKFDHPLWVPEGGIPDWKEVPHITSEESHPERPGEPDCPYFMKTSKCKFGSKCKFNHPKEKALVAGSDNEESVSADSSVLPVRPSEPLCLFYSKTGKCKFGANCKFNHPKDIQIPSSGKETENTAKAEATGDNGAADGGFIPGKMPVPFAPPAEAHNSKGLPIRPGEVDCPFYMKTGSCKYGSTCRYNHPDRQAIISPLVAPLGQSILPSVATTAPTTMLNPAATFLQGFEFHAAHVPVEAAPTIYPQRPGETFCDFYMKTGNCKYAERCKFHHPMDRSAPGSDVKQEAQQAVKLTLAGLPRREDAEVCAFYMKTGTCKFGVNCKFDHPPPGEAVAKLTMQGTGGADHTATGGED